MRQFVRDLDPETGRLDLRMCAPDAFTVGEIIAATPGKVVFQNDLIQLIQYTPATETVRRRPMLLIPPWMNKYYVMDLRTGNSMVEWLVGQGHTVFIISWVNPDSSFAGKGFDDYMLEGPLAALEAVERATGEREVNAVGYCLGGILLSALSAWLHAKGDTRFASTTYLATMVDFSDVGAVGVFIDEDGLPALEFAISAQGYLSGQQVADTWRAVRANDLIWSFWVNSYLLGKEPPALDLLFWNCDPTNMPAAMHTFVMRNMYVGNRLRGARRAHPRGRSDRRHAHHDSVLRAVDRRGSHCTVEDDLRDHAALRRSGGVRARGVRTHRGRHQSTREAEVLVQDRLGDPLLARGVARGGARARGFVVAALGSVARSVRRRRGARADTRERWPPGHRGCSRKLRHAADAAGLTPAAHVLRTFSNT